MTHSYQYLIVGGGMTADAAVRGIRSIDQSGSIGIIAGEPHPPYKRPPLSKGLWKGDPTESIWLTHAKQSALLHPSRTASQILTSKNEVIDDHGDVYGFHRLLLATGGIVRKMKFEVNGIIYFRTFEDYELLKQRAPKGSAAVVVGGGFIGSEIAAALAMNGVHVTMIFPEEGIGARVYPRRLAMSLNDYYASKGVRVLANEQVTDIGRQGDVYHVRGAGGAHVEADVVVAGIGIQPNTELARSARLDVENGIVVSEFLQTSNPAIYAAGDVANFFSPALDKRIRVEHEDNANTMGECAGRNMAGKIEPYHHLPFFYSDLFELGYEAVGETDSKLDTVEDWKEEFREGVVYYLKDQRIRGVLLWNTWGQVEHARALIGEKQRFAENDVKGQLPR